MKGVKLIYVFYSTLLVLVLLVAYAVFAVSGENIPLNQENTISLDNVWYYHNEAKQWQSINLPTRLDVPKGDTAKIAFNLPTIYEQGRTLCIRTSYQTLRVSLAGNIIYQYGIEDDRPFSKSPGSAWHLVELPKGSEGQGITIELMSPYKIFSGQINAITLGDRGTHLFHIIKEHAAGILFCVWILFLGLAFLVLYFFPRKKIPQNRSLLYLGLFAILVAVWSFTETRAPQIFFENTFVILLLTYLSLMLCPLPLLFFIKENYLSRHKFLYDMLCTAFLLNFFVCTILQVCNIADFLETIFSIHILIACAVLMILANCLEEIFKYKNKKIYLFAFSMVLLCVFVGIDMASFYMGRFEDNSFFFRIGLLFYVLILGVDIITKTVPMISLGQEAKVLKRLAYLDPLTKKKNRTAFDLEMDHLLEYSKNACNIVIMEFDLNYFKDVNDTFGHKTGDEVLVASAQCIDNAFCGLGECFRIGGDEFAVILPDCSDEQLELALAKLQMIISEYNETHTNKVDIAWGYARFDSELDKNLYALLNRADKKMYQQKHKRKQGA